MAKTKTSIQKGEVKNPNGRPKGSSNKATTETRQYFKMFVEKNYTQFEEDFKELTPHERIKTIIDLAKLVLPKQVEAEVNQRNEPQTITFITIDENGNRTTETSD